MTRRAIRGISFGAVALVATAAWGAGYRLEKRFDVGSGGSLSLRTETGNVSVRGGGDEAIVTVISDREDFEDVYSVRVDQGPAGRLEVVIERKSRGPASWFGGDRGRTEITVALPASASAEIAASGGRVEVSNLDGAVRAKSSGGGIHVADLGGEATLESSGGRVEAERVEGDVDAKSSGGAVEVRQIGGSARLRSSGGSVDGEEIGGDVEAASSGGGVRIREAHGAVVADSSGGPVKVAFASGNSSGGSIGSSGGGVDVRLDAAAAVDLDAVASGGSVSSDLGVTVHGKIQRDTLKGEINGGGPLLKLRSSGGGITIVAR